MANRSELYRHYSLYHFAAQLLTEYGHLTSCPVQHCNKSGIGGKKLADHMGQVHNQVCLGLNKHYSWCSFSILLGWANANKVWANAIKMPDQHKYYKKGFLHPTIRLERVLKYSYLVSIILNYQFPKTMFADFLVLILDFISISSHFNSIDSSQ
jgi:hypothetical protein